MDDCDNMDDSNLALLVPISTLVRPLQRESERSMINFWAGCCSVELLKIYQTPTPNFFLRFI